MKEKTESEKILEGFEKKGDKFVIKLSKPFQFGQGRLVETLELSEPKAKHIRKMPTSPIMDDILKICGALAGEPDSLIDELSLKDCNKLAEFVSAFN